MIYVQSKGKVTQSITLFDKHFNFSYSDPRDFNSIDIKYSDVASKLTEQVEENEWLRIVGFAWMAIGLCQLLFALYFGYSASGKEFWLVVGGLCVFWSYASVVKYTIIKTEHGNICIIHDGKHDKILSELQAKRHSCNDTPSGSCEFPVFSGNYCCLETRKEFSISDIPAATADRTTSSPYSSSRGLSGPPRLRSSSRHKRINRLLIHAE